MAQEICKQVGEELTEMTIELEEKHLANIKKLKKRLAKAKEKEQFLKNENENLKHMLEESEKEHIETLDKALNIIKMIENGIRELDESYEKTKKEADESFVKAKKEAEKRRKSNEEIRRLEESLEMVKNSHEKTKKELEELHEEICKQKCNKLKRKSKQLDLQARKRSRRSYQLEDPSNMRNEDSNHH